MQGQYVFYVLVHIVGEMKKMSIAKKMTKPKCIDIDQLYFQTFHYDTQQNEKRREQQKNKLLCDTGHILANGLSGSFGSFFVNRLVHGLDNFRPEVDHNHVFLIGFKSPKNAEENTKKLYENNIQRFVKTLENSKTIASPHFTFLSAISVYGNDWDGRDLRANPLKNDYYSEAKLEAENLLINHCEQSANSFTILRVPGLISPKCERNFICNSYHKIVKNKTIDIRSPNNLFNNIFSFKDLFTLLKVIAQDPNNWRNQIINLGASQPLPVIECLNILGSLASKPVHARVTGKANERVICVDKLSKLGFIPDSVSSMLHESFS